MTVVRSKIYLNILDKFTKFSTLLYAVLTTALFGRIERMTVLVSTKFYLRSLVSNLISNHI